MAIPALGTLAVEPLYVLVDTAIVGHLGTTALGGLALATTVLLAIVSCCNFLAYGTTPAVAFERGAARADRAADVGIGALWLCAFIGLPVAVGLVAVAHRVSSALGGHGAVLHAAVTYLRISAVGIPFVLATIAAQGVLRGFNELGIALKILAAANVANVILEIVAVYVMHLGVAGSAWSTVIVQIVASIVFLIVLRPYLAPAVERRPSWTRLRPLLVVGRHLVQRVAAMTVVFTGATAIAAHVDTPTLAAHQLVMQTFLFLALMLDALAIPAQSLVAESLGRHDRRDAIDIGRRSRTLSAATGVALGLGLAVVSAVLPRVFTNDDAVVSRATFGYLILAVILIPGAIAFAFDGVLIGFGDFKFLGWASVANLAAFAPLAVATLVAPRLGIAGLWGALAMWMVTRAVVNTRRFDDLVRSGVR